MPNESLTVNLSCGKQLEFTLIRSKRRSLSIEIGRNGQLIAKAPLRMPLQAIEAFIEQKSTWIIKKLDETNKGLESAKVHSSPSVLTAKAKLILPERIEYFSKAMGLYPSAVKITSAKKRFGSCNAKNSLCFSMYLMDYPIEAIDYVVVHELAHIRHKNHSRAFYSLIGDYLPDYREREKILKDIYWKPES